MDSSFLLPLHILTQDAGSLLSSDRPEAESQQLDVFLTRLKGFISFEEIEDAAKMRSETSSVCRLVSQANLWLLRQ